jgi:hypothetical protein
VNGIQFKEIRKVSQENKSEPRKIWRKQENFFNKKNSAAKYEFRGSAQIPRHSTDSAARLEISLAAENIRPKNNPLTNYGHQTA